MSAPTALATEALREGLALALAPPCVLVGVGNRQRGDDAFGPLLIDRVAGRITAPCIDAGIAPENHVEAVARHEPRHILLIDSGDLGATPGTLRLVSPDDLACGPPSTHAGGLDLLARYWLARCGASCHLLLVQPADTRFAPQPILSSPVGAALDQAFGLIVAATAAPE